MSPAANIRSKSGSANFLAKLRPPKLRAHVVHSIFARESLWAFRLDCRYLGGRTSDIARVIREQGQALLATCRKAARILALPIIVRLMGPHRGHPQLIDALTSHVGFRCGRNARALGAHRRRSLGRGRTASDDGTRTTLRLFGSNTRQDRELLSGKCLMDVAMLQFRSRHGLTISVANQRR